MQGHDFIGFLPRPNQAIMWAFQAMAKGAEAFIFFRYRNAIKGAEQFCSGILDTNNKKKRKFYEVKCFFESISKNKRLFETKINNNVAILYDYDSLAGFRVQGQSYIFNYVAEVKKLYKVFHDYNIGVDIIPENTVIDNYKVLIVPFMMIQKKELLSRLKDFVKKGGKIIFTTRTWIKDKDNNFILNEDFPLKCTDFIGGYIDETESLQEYDEIKLKGVGIYKDNKGNGGIFRDLIKTTTAETLYLYDDKFYGDYSAITKNKYDQGEVYYIGCCVETAILETLLTDIIDSSNIEKRFLAEKIEIIERKLDNDVYFLCINHNDFSIKIGNIEFSPFEYKTLKKY